MSVGARQSRVHCILAASPELTDPLLMAHESWVKVCNIHVSYWQQSQITCDVKHLHVTFHSLARFLQLKYATAYAEGAELSNVHATPLICVLFSSRIVVSFVQVGLAEAAVAMGKLARRQGDAAAAATHFTAAVGHYSK